MNALQGRNVPTLKKKRNVDPADVAGVKKFRKFMP